MINKDKKREQCCLFVRREVIFRTEQSQRKKRKNFRLENRKGENHGTIARAA